MCLLAQTMYAQNGGSKEGYVDLGLSVKWATCNLGASKPEEYGDYYAWGETQTKKTYDWSVYKWSRGSDDSITKYNTRPSSGGVDNKTVLDAEDDVARVRLGGKWRMPTDAEWTELRKNCTWTRTTRNGVSGYKVTSKNNGNSIFLPAAGARDELDDSFSGAGTTGCLWSSSLDPDHPDSAWCVSFGSNYVFRGDGCRSFGCSVRPVFAE